MTSLISHKAQIPAFTFYIVENTGGRMLRTLTLGNTYNLDSNTILADMGTTSVINGYIYRKVQVVTVTDQISSGNATGFICLNSDSAPLFDGARQNINKLN